MRLDALPAGGIAVPAADVNLGARYRRRMRLADTLQVLCVLSVAVVIALFLADGGAAQFGTPADALTSLGVLCGLVGSDLLLVMLLLAARLPPVDRAFGHDRAMSVHQSLGKPVLYLLLAHAALLVGGYAMLQPTSYLDQVWVMFTTLPDMPLAFAGLGLLVLVVITSIVVVRRRFRYEAWHAVHLLAYAAVLAAIPHQLSVGALFAEGRLQRYYWLALYAGVAGSILVFRFVVPIVRSLRHRLVVSGLGRVAPGVVSIRLSGRGLRRLGVSGGQFFIWRFWTPDLWWQAHPFSLSGAPSSEGLRITVRGLGDASAALAAVPPGTRVSFEGPYGLFTERARTSPRIVMVASGIGVAPIRSLLETASFAPGDATVILRSPTLADTYLADEVGELCRLRGAQLRIIAGHRAPGVDSWLPADAVSAGITLASLAPQLADADLYICGPRQWTEAVVNDARSAGLRSRQIHYERFNW
jgi:predicted ferric reductase